MFEACVFREIGTPSTSKPVLFSRIQNTCPKFLGGYASLPPVLSVPPPKISGPHTSYTELMGKLQRERFFYFVRHIGGQPGGLDLSQLAVRAVLDAMGLFSHLPLVPWEPPSLCRFGIKPEFLQNLADRLHGFNYPTRADGNYK